MTTETMKRTAAEEILLKEITIALDCMKSFGGSRIQNLVNGVSNTLIAKQLEIEQKAENPEGMRIAEEYLQAEINLVLSCLDVFDGTPVAGVAKKIRRRLEVLSQA